jgi:2-phosphosulfolactate phosphatase
VEFRFVSNEECGDVEGVAVVVDVLRAFSFAAYALAAGAERLVLMDDLDETLRLARSIPGAMAAKDGVPADGFELFNSPGQLLERADIAGKTIVHRTTAGTVGAMAARHAEHLYCSSFVVAGATADRIRAIAPERVTFVITGGVGRSDDDLACAEYLCERIRGGLPDPGPFLRRVDAAGEGLREGVARGYRGVHRDDVDLCCELDRFPFALRALNEHGLLVLRPG